MPVIGEPFREVSPGFLPRTLDQLRRGVENDAMRPENRLRRRRLSVEEERPAEPQQSLDAALDSLLAEASDEETPRASGELASQAGEASQLASLEQERAQRNEARQRYQEHLLEAEAQNRRRLLAARGERDNRSFATVRGEARLQRARERFARVFGTAEEIQQDDYESPLSTMYNRAYDRYNQAETRRATDTTSPPPLEGLSPRERQDIEEHILWGVMRESANQAGPEDNVWSYSPRRDGVDDTPQSDQSAFRDIVDATDDPDRLAALRNTMQTLSTNPPTEPYPGSVPLTGTATPNSPAAVATGTGLTRMQQSRFERLLAHRTELEQFLPAPSLADFQSIGQLNDTMEVATEPSQSSVPSSSSSGNGNGMSQIQTSIQQITSELHRLRLASEAITSARHSMHTHFQPQPERPPQTLDNQPGRPSAMSEEEMTRKLECQVCYQQLANIALLPCGHMVMCQWCADVVIPVKHTHLPVRPSKCPMCRKTVKQRFKIHMG
jgi:hypothetical protein